MRIGLDLTHCYQRSGGIQRYARELTRALIEHAGENDYVLFFRGAAEAVEPRTGHVEVRVGPRWMHQILCEQTWLLREAQKAGLDVFHATGFAGPAGYRGVSVGTVCDMNPFRHPETMTRSQRLYWRRLFPQALRARRRIVAISNGAAADIRTFLPHLANRVTVAPLGCSDVFRRSRTAAEVQGVVARLNLPDRFFLVVGTLEPRKNLARLIEAYASLRRSRHGVPDLVFVGRPGWLWQAQAARADQLQVSAFVHFTGPVENDVLACLYRTSAALLYPSVYEGFGLPIVEAMASGCPVVTSTAPSMPEVAGDAAEYVDPMSVDDMTRGFAAVLDGDRRHGLAERGRRRAEAYTWEHTARLTLDAYRLAANG